MDKQGPLEEVGGLVGRPWEKRLVPGPERSLSAPRRQAATGRAQGKRASRLRPVLGGGTRPA